jgi:hypothetical protein
MKIFLRHEFFPLLRLLLLPGCRKAVSRSATFVGRRQRKEDARVDPTNNHAYTLEEMLFFDMSSYSIGAIKRW